MGDEGVYGLVVCRKRLELIRGEVVTCWPQPSMNFNKSATTKVEPPT